MATFDDDYGWQRRFIPALKRICADVLVGEAPAEEDRRRNTDLIVLGMEAVRVACRVRRADVLSNAEWRDQFTIREHRPNGCDSELAKLLSGWGDYLIYAIATDDRSSELGAWVVGDLSVFRLWFQRRCATLHPGRLPGAANRNADGSSTFRAFRIADLPVDFVVARHAPWGPEPAGRRIEAVA